MGLFGRLKALIGGEPRELPPPDVYGALIDDLYAPLFSLIAGATTTIFGGLNRGLAYGKFRARRIDHLHRFGRGRTHSHRIRVP